jgi:3-dehydroquinate dehydratase II
MDCNGVVNARQIFFAVQQNWMTKQRMSQEDPPPDCAASHDGVSTLTGGLAMSRLIYVLNGPNLNLLGKRQPHIYGHETLADVENACRKAAATHGLSLNFHQSNREYEIIDWIHVARENAAGIVINPAAFTHTSVAILDALNTFDSPVIEVHISNVHKREAFRHHSYVSLRADGVITGLGTQGYLLAIERLAFLIAEKAGKKPA